MNFEKYNLDRHKPLLGKRKILLYKDQGSSTAHLLNHTNVTRVQKIHYAFYLWKLCIFNRTDIRGLEL